MKWIGARLEAKEWVFVPIHCGQVKQRGHYASATAEKYDLALQEAFYKGVAIHFIENNVDQLPDRLLQQCYELYRQRNGLVDD